MKNKPFYIIGFMGTGKSSLRPHLETTATVVDLDERLVEVLGMDVATYFERMGEEAFREAEARLLREVKADFILTGGGVVERKENIDWMKTNGTMVALRLPFTHCWERIRESDRPLVRSGERTVMSLYEQRGPLYDLASIQLDGTRSSKELASDLLRLKENAL